MIKRRKPGKETREEMLELWGNKCFWCGTEFGSWAVSKNGKRSFVLKPVWDHFVPHNFFNVHRWSRPARELEFVPSCKLCNGHKSDFVFTSITKGRRYLKKRIKEKGWTIIHI